MWGEMLQALGEGGQGALEGYTWGKKYQQDERKIEQQAEIQRLNAEIKTMLETLKEQGRNDRHGTASGSVVAQQEGATSRADANNETRRSIAEMNADVQRNNEAGRNRRFEQGITSSSLWREMQDRTRRRGQDIGAGTASQRDATTRRGQDLSRETAGQRDETTRRGQDAATERARMRGGTGGSAWDDAEALMEAGAAGETGDPDMPPPPPAPPRTLPAPAGPVTPPAPGGGAGRAALAAQLRTAIDAVRNAKTPEDRARARQELARLRALVK